MEESYVKLNRLGVRGVTSEGLWTRDLDKCSGTRVLDKGEHKTNTIN